MTASRDRADVLKCVSGQSDVTTASVLPQMTQVTSLSDLMPVTVMPTLTGDVRPCDSDVTRLTFSLSIFLSQATVLGHHFPLAHSHRADRDSGLDNSG